MSVIEWKKVETVGVITMNNGENRHNPDFVRAILAAFDEVEGDPGISSVIIASSDPKNWSQGIDLQWMMGAMEKNDLQGIRDFMYGLNRIFKRILLYPMPVIAAINGHAFGDGTIMACACDFRFMKADRGFFCLSGNRHQHPLSPRNAGHRSGRRSPATSSRNSSSAGKEPGPRNWKPTTSS